MIEPNGRWQLAFWIITVICGAWLIFLTSGVVANDRIRASEDDKLKTLIYESVQKINYSIAQITGDIREIKVEIKRS